MNANNKHTHVTYTCIRASVYLSWMPSCLTYRSSWKTQRPFQPLFIISNNKNQMITSSVDFIHEWKWIFFVSRNSEILKYIYQWQSLSHINLIILLTTTKSMIAFDVFTMSFECGASRWVMRCVIQYVWAWHQSLPYRRNTHKFYRQYHFVRIFGLFCPPPRDSFDLTLEFTHTITKSTIWTCIKPSIYSPYNYDLRQTQVLLSTAIRSTTPPISHRCVRC